MMETAKINVLKRDRRLEEIHIGKLMSRIKKLCYGLNTNFFDPASIANDVISVLYDGISTEDLDNLAADKIASMSPIHPDYVVLAGRIAISNLQKKTKKAFSDVVNDLHNVMDMESDKPSPLISDYHHRIIMEHSKRLNSAIVYDRDFGYNYFSFKILEQTFLLKINGKIAERPQHLYMRVAIGIHGDDIDAAIETYNLLSERYYQASSTTLAAASRFLQLPSAFLLTMSEDSIEGIYKTITNCALLSKSSDSGIGISVHSVRAKATPISGTNVKSNFLMPMLKSIICSAHLVENRKTNQFFTVYLEPWHSDIFEFLNFKNHIEAEDSQVIADALWIPDLFMNRVKNDEDWSLMCPQKCPGLSDVWGEKFVKLYTKYENEGNFSRKIRAQFLWNAIIESQIETGTPYILYKDACNRKSNQKNVGTIKCSNLSTELIEYSAPDEIAVCNHASIALDMFVNSSKKDYDFIKLKEVTKIITKNLNKIIDMNYYPLAEARKSSFCHRSIGIGVQGFADTLISMHFPYESDEAKLLNQQIFETIYYGALEASCELAEENKPYQTYDGSPISKGILQYDLWQDKTPTNLWNWDELKKRIAKYGVRNSLLVALMPTEFTSQILGNNASFEPYASNIFKHQLKSTLGEEFQIVNHHLVKDLIELNLWNDEMKNAIISNYGSIQNIEIIPKTLRDIYKTVWEISMESIINMAADRGAFIDQSQSFNIYLAEPNYGKLSLIHFLCWNAGLKTGMYHLRTMSDVANANNQLLLSVTPKSKDSKPFEFFYTPCPYLKQT